jgi:poly(A) polymerase Pap1
LFGGKELRQLGDAYVPVIKFTFEDIEVDLTFARLNQPVPTDEKELLVGRQFSGTIKHDL